MQQSIFVIRSSRASGREKKAAACALIFVGLAFPRGTLCANQAANPSNRAQELEAHIDTPIFTRQGPVSTWAFPTAAHAKREGLKSGTAGSALFLLPVPSTASSAFDKALRSIKSRGMPQVGSSAEARKLETTWERPQCPNAKGQVLAYGPDHCDVFKQYRFLNVSYRGKTHNDMGHKIQVGGPSLAGPVDLPNEGRKDELVKRLTSGKRMDRRARTAALREAIGTEALNIQWKGQTRLVTTTIREPGVWLQSVAKRHFKTDTPPDEELSEAKMVHFVENTPAVWNAFTRFLVGNFSNFFAETTDSRTTRTMHVRNKHFDLMAPTADEVTAWTTGDSGREMLEEAKRVLEHEIAFFALSHDLVTSVKLLSYTFCWGEPLQMPEYPRRISPHATPGLMKAVREHSSLDVELYAFATELFERRLADMRVRQLHDGLLCDPQLKQVCAVSCEEDKLSKDSEVNCNTVEISGFGASLSSLAWLDGTYRLSRPGEGLTSSGKAFGRRFWIKSFDDPEQPDVYLYWNDVHFGTSHWFIDDDFDPTDVFAHGATKSWSKKQLFNAGEAAAWTVGDGEHRVKATCSGPGPARGEL